MAKLNIICVIYNKKISEITSLNEFLDLDKKYVNLFVVDNSISEISNANFEEYTQLYKSKITYISNHGNNYGLSKNYNKVINLINDDNYYLMTADDDTYFSKEYLNNCLDICKSENELLISGIVTSQNGAMSPLREFKIINNSFITKPGKYKNIYCINSGLTIHSSILNKIKGYDEKLFLDMIDYWLMDTLIDLNLNEIDIIPGEIKQSFSGQSYSNKESMLKRYNMYKKDCLMYSKLLKKNRLKIVIILIIRRLRILLLSISNDN